jgi:hypothetical protein
MASFVNVSEFASTASTRAPGRHPRANKSESGTGAHSYLPT